MYKCHPKVSNYENSNGKMQTSGKHDMNPNGVKRGENIDEIIMNK